MSRLTANEIVERVYDETSGTLKTSLSATPSIDIGDVTVLPEGGVGSLTETAPATDTASSALNGRLQRIAQRITSLLATDGVPTGAAVTTDVDGTLQQYLRGIVKLIAAIISVKIDQTTPGTTNKVVADPVTATPTIYNITLTNANTEYSQALPANCRGFEFQCQTGVQCRWSNVTGKVATPTAPWMTLRPNAWYVSPPINQGASPSTLYFGSATAGAIIELIAYT